MVVNEELIYVKSISKNQKTKYSDNSLQKQKKQENIANCVYKIMEVYKEEKITKFDILER